MQAVILPYFTIFAGTIYAPAPPDTPTDFQLSANNADRRLTPASIYVQWTCRSANEAPQTFVVTVQNFDAQTDVAVESKNDTKSNCRTNSTQTMLFVDNILPDVDYRVRLRSLNSAGRGDVVEFSVRTPPRPRLAIISMSFDRNSAVIEYGVSNWNASAFRLKMTVELCELVVALRCRHYDEIVGTPPHRRVVLSLPGSAVGTEYSLDMYLFDLNNACIAILKGQRLHRRNGTQIGELHTWCFIKSEVPSRSF